MENTDEKIAENSESERLKQIHACVSRIKASEEAGVKYMQKWEEKIKSALLRRDSSLEGIMSTMVNAMSQSFTVNGEKFKVVLSKPRK